MPGFEDVRAGADLKATAQNLTFLCEKTWGFSRHIRQICQQEKELGELSLSLISLRNGSIGNIWPGEGSAFRQGVDIGVGLAQSLLYPELSAQLGNAYRLFESDFKNVTDPEPAEATEKKRSFVSAVGWNGIEKHSDIKTEIDSIITSLHPQLTQPEWLWAGCGVVLWVVNSADIMATRQIASDLESETSLATQTGIPSALDREAWALFDAYRDPT